MSEDTPNFTNIMEAQKHEREKAHGGPEIKFELTDSEPDEQPATAAIIVPEGEELAVLLQTMRNEIADLKAELSETSRKVDSEYDLSDDMIYLCRPNGERWVERRVVDKKAVSIDCAATAFYGPFETEELVDEYLTEKRSKREDSYVEWADVTPRSGREARAIRRAEDEDREANFVGESRINVLDRRIFAQAQGGHTPGQGTLVGRS